MSASTTDPAATTDARRHDRRPWRRWVALTLVAGALLAGTLSDSLATGDASLHLSTVSITSVDDLSTTGTSMLRRSESGMSARLATWELAPGHAYSVWARVFNNPAACDGPCDASELDDSGVDGAEVLLTSRVVRSDRAEFRGDLEVGPVLHRPATAEIHVVVRSHGPALDATWGGQVSERDSGCPPNECVDVQLAVHR